MAEDKKIYLYHHDSSVKTLREFMEKERIDFISLDDLWKENKDFIFSQMSLQDKFAYKQENGKFPEKGGDLSSNMTLPCPCKLRVNPRGITAEVAISQTNFEVNTDDFYAFEDEKIQEILNEAQSSFVDKSSPNVQVYGWCKALSLFYKRKTSSKDIFEKSSSQDSWFDFSRFIISMNTNVSVNGGNFTIRLPFIDISDYAVWWNGPGVVAKTNTHNFGKDIADSLTGEFADTRNNDFFKRVPTMIGTKGRDFFSAIISSNDLFFISFKKEEHTTQKQSWYEDEENQASFSVDFHPELEGKFPKRTVIREEEADKVISQTSFDMIALVDDVKVTHSANGDACVEISGRDLMKLITDDGSFFFNPSVCSDPSFIFYNYENDTAQGDLRDVDKVVGNTALMYNEEEENGKRYAINRLRGAANEIDIFRSPLNNSIDFIIKGVISQLANIEVVPREVFSLWENKTTWNELKPEK